MSETTKSAEDLKSELKQEFDKRTQLIIDTSSLPRTVSAKLDTVFEFMYREMNSRAVEALKEAAEVANVYPIKRDILNLINKYK